MSDIITFSIWIWMALVGLFIVGLSIGSLCVIRSYKVINGKIYVKHGLFGKWHDLLNHIEDEHKEIR